MAFTSVYPEDLPEYCLNSDDVKAYNELYWKIINGYGTMTWLCLFFL